MFYTRKQRQNSGKFTTIYVGWVLMIVSFFGAFLIRFKLIESEALTYVFIVAIIGSLGVLCGINSDDYEENQTSV
jgi:uncharacterized membrane protein YeaQ/YmgE (transglycosylase-associated protein family)